MNWFGKLSLGLRVLTVLGALAGILGVVGGTYAYIDHQGYVRGYSVATAEWTKKYQDLIDELDKAATVETNRQNAANAAAKAAEAAEIAALNDRLEAQAALNLQLLKEAADDPNHDRPGLDAAAVARINRRH